MCFWHALAQQELEAKLESVEASLDGRLQRLEAAVEELQDSPTAAPVEDEKMFQLQVPLVNATACLVYRDNIYRHDQGKNGENMSIGLDKCSDEQGLRYPRSLWQVDKSGRLVQAAKKMCVTHLKRDVSD